MNDDVRRMFTFGVSLHFVCLATYLKYVFFKDHDRGLRSDPLVLFQVALCDVPAV